MSSMIRMSYLLSIGALASIMLSTVLSLTFSLISTITCLISIITNKGKTSIIALAFSLLVLAFVFFTAFISITSYSVLE